MPTQHTLMGRPVTLQMPPRRFQVVFIVLFFLIVNLTFYGPPSRESIPTYDQVADAVKHPQAHVPDIGELPAVPNPFGPSAHKPPPAQANNTAASAYGAIEWLTDFKWRNPFSSAVTLDENRALLPPLRPRTPIYTYYDVPKKQAKDISAAEQRLLLAWRRAWWAQGFKPVVLSRDEAKQNPLYQLFQRMKLDPKLEFEVMRWLAWGHMKGGILVNWLALPMAEYDNPMLSFLRRNEYPKLSRVQSLDNAVFFGEKMAVDDAIKKLTNNELLKNVTANKDKLAKLANKEGGPVVNLLGSGGMTVDAKADGIASYNMATISSKYKTVSDKFTNTTQAEALDLLENLINSHLHLTWQEQHPEGVAIVKPVPEHTTVLMYEANSIGRNLTQCPTSPMPKTCPPNRPKCKPCDANKAMKIQVFPEFVNTTKFFTIGTVPHPYTLTSLHYTRDTIDTNFLRNNAKRDLWIQKLTDKSIPGDHTEQTRVLRFKELVAAAPAHSLWLTAERITQDDLDWIFGFGLPQNASTTKEPSSPSKESELILFPRPAPPKPIEGVDVPDEKWIEKEEERLKKARDAIKSKDKNMKLVVEAVEKWNLADTEAWRFSRAYSARRRQERKKWEEEEAKYSGSEKKAGVRPGEGGGRWIDRR
ncbi:hypothetical protein DDE82_002384 [Stemphylium lycopersici]|uniref:Uncharacterized protein n=1 Tax=Stemphylium lycopersici TaxID=183478 RepID=A0A364N1K1_STELY|nr:hypothetical protein TW65_03180 [Stemphylium lycopersici]RAR08403.1 hypothetical protein DDE82_002384 [Stemphylium lycopersici]RAR09491.1 hypothetical protein DDE83_005484 [Stemphylium lycopersici]